MVCVAGKLRGGYLGEKQKYRKPVQTRPPSVLLREYKRNIVGPAAVLFSLPKSWSPVKRLWARPRGLTTVIAAFLSGLARGARRRRIFPAVFLRNLRRVPDFSPQQPSVGRSAGRPASQPDSQPVLHASVSCPPGLRHRISWSRDRQRHLAWFWYFLLAPCWCG